MKRLFQLKKVERETLSPENFLKLTQRDRSNISFSEIIPASLGKPDFGKIRVYYKTPIYK